MVRVSVERLLRGKLITNCLTAADRVAGSAAEAAADVAVLPR
jgi:hypothetical protein